MTKKATWEENGLLQLITLGARSIPEGSQGGNSNTRITWRQELKRRPWRNDAYWLASHDLLSLLSYTIQDHLSRNGPTHSGLGPPTSTINQKKKNALETCLTEALFFSIMIPSSSICLGLCQSDKTQWSQSQINVIEEL